MSLSLRDQLIQAGYAAPKPEPKPEPKSAPRPQHGGGGNRHSQAPSGGRRPDGGRPQHGKPGGERSGAGRPQADARAQSERHQQAARPQTAKPAREATGNTEPSLAHAYQIRAETEKREREAAQKRAQEEAQRKREQRAQLAQLVAGKALNDPSGEHARNFTYSKKIRKVNATAAQILALNAGELGVVQVDGRFLILPPDLVREALALAPQHVALFVPEGIGASENPAEDYSDPRFKVPDDLVW